MWALSLRNSRPETVIVQGAVKFNLIQLSQVSKYVECDEKGKKRKTKTGTEKERKNNKGSGEASWVFIFVSWNLENKDEERSRRVGARQRTIISNLLNSCHRLAEWTRTSRPKVTLKIIIYDAPDRCPKRQFRHWLAYKKLRPSHHK